MHGPPDNPDARLELKRARDRRHYRRQLAELAVAPVEYSGATIDYLEKYGWFHEGDDRDDPRCIGDAIARLVRDAVEAG